jgi:hypothetical protein
VRSKNDYYDAMVLNKFFMPSYKSSIITLQTMELMRAGVVYCPKISDVHPIKVVHPPKNDDLQVMVR